MLSSIAASLAHIKPTILSYFSPEKLFNCHEFSYNFIQMSQSWRLFKIMVLFHKVQLYLDNTIMTVLTKSSCFCFPRLKKESGSAVNVMSMSLQTIFHTCGYGNNIPIHQQVQAFIKFNGTILFTVDLASQCGLTQKSFHRYLRYHSSSTSQYRNNQPSPHRTLHFRLFHSLTFSLPGSAQALQPNLRFFCKCPH